MRWIGAGWRGLRSVTFEAPDLPVRIPGLDGLRAIAIGLVLLVHATLSPGFPSALRDLDTLRSLGVRIFFVISGFLITTLLLQEWRDTGRISLLRFYLRRSLRIFPAFYAYVAVVVVLAAAGLVSLRPGDIGHALTYTMNYHYPAAWEVFHFWSLSVEEQFYLLWPPLLVWLGPTRAVRCAAIVVVATPLIRIVQWYGWPLQRDGSGGQFQLVADALAVGCLLAGAYNWLGARRWYVRLLTSRWFVLMPIVVLVTNELHWRPRTYLVAQTLTHVAIAVCVDRCVRIRSGWIDRVLNAAPFRFVGAISYSLYLWQQPFLSPNTTLPTAFPWNVGLAVACAVASHYLVERPLLRLKDRLGGGVGSRRRLPTSSTATISTVDGLPVAADRA
jgi:peptidoglycan/LPS O-acetylase OafA/YrhL